jgi:cold shock CspA family protein
MRGTLLSWHRGFGFIEPANGSGNIFLPASEIGYAQPAIGDEVSFDTRPDAEGKVAATAVKVIRRSADLDKRISPKAGKRRTRRGRGSRKRYNERMAALGLPWALPKLAPGAPAVAPTPLPTSAVPASSMAEAVERLRKAWGAR